MYSKNWYQIMSFFNATITRTLPVFVSFLALLATIFSIFSICHIKYILASKSLVTQQDEQSHYNVSQIS